MLIIGAELLAGRYVATAYNDRDRAEWPPHPARLFSAMVATWAEGEPSTPAGEEEIDALRWLECLAAPTVLASGMSDIALRTVVPVFVPVNDVGVVSIPDSARLHAAEAIAAAASDTKARTKAEKDVAKWSGKLASDTAKATASPAKASAADLVAAVQMFPERRLRQPRTFPSVAPAVPSVAFVWPDATPTPEHSAALARLLGRLVRLGHSSSFVHARLLDQGALGVLEASTSSFTPDVERGTHVLRWVAAGQSERLIAAFERHREVEPRVLPAIFMRYREGAVSDVHVPATTSFGHDWMVFARVSGPRLPMTAVAGIARQFRRALMSFADDPIAEMISGHHAGGSVSDVPHLAVVPLPFVASEHADGSLLGIALVLPRDASHSDRAAVVRAVEKFEASQPTEEGGAAPVIPLQLGAAGTLRLQRVVWGEHKNAGLRPSSWTAAARHWASATPVALDQNPGDLHDIDPGRRRAAIDAATATVAVALQRIGALPAPSQIDVLRSCVLAGTAKPRSFPRFPAEPGRTQRVLVHVRIVFPSPVCGPILLGSGRYQGLGLLRPVMTTDEANR